MKKVKILPGYENVDVQIIFDINMDGKFTRKEIFVADVHKKLHQYLFHNQVLCPGRVLRFHFHFSN